MDIQHLNSAAQNAAAGYVDASAVQLLRRPAVVEGQSLSLLPQAPQAAAPAAELDPGLGRHIDVKA
jgi:hypothetical protein